MENCCVDCKVLYKCKITAAIIFISPILYRVVLRAELCLPPAPNSHVEIPIPSISGYNVFGDEVFKEMIKL